MHPKDFGTDLNELTRILSEADRIYNTTNIRFEWNVNHLYPHELANCIIYVLFLPKINIPSLIDAVEIIEKNCLFRYE